MAYNLSPKETALLMKLSEQVARNYCRRCWWADPNDVSQEAWFGILRSLARDKFDAAKGGLQQYAWVTMTQWCRGYLWKAGSPVNASYNRLEELRGLVRVSVDLLPGSTGPSVRGTNGDSRKGLSPLLIDTRPWPDAVVEARRWEYRVRNAVTEALDGFEPVEAAAAIEILSKETSPAEIAARLSLSQRQVYRLRSVAFDFIAGSPQLRRLWKEHAETPPLAHKSEVVL